MQRTDMLDNQDTIEKLNDLIQLDFDAVKAYDDAIVRIDAEHTDVRMDLESFKADHERHIADLSMVVTDLGGTPQDGPDLKGILIDGVTKLRSVTGTVGALKAMRMNERLTNKSYERAIQLALSPIALAVVERNLADERRHLATILAHIERLAAEDDVGEDLEDEDIDRSAIGERGAFV